MPGSTTTKSSRNCYLSLVPMSVRQQLKLVRQLETSDKNGGDPGIKDTVLQRPRSRSCNGRGETLLHKAAIKGDKEWVVKLLEEGADPNVSDFAGWTPLHEACNHGWYGVALALIKAGASVNATGFDDDTPLHDAAINGHSKLVRLLVEQGADVHFRNKGGKTPCDVAAPGLMPHLLPCTSVEKNETCKKFDNSLRTSAQDVDSPAISEKRRALPRTKVEKGSKVTLGLNQIKKKENKLKTENSDYNISNKIKNLNNMEEKNSKEDVYEFKSSKEATPVRGNSISPDVDKNSEVKSEKVEGYSGTEAESVAVKRTISEVGDNDEVEDDSKKRKRKEKEGDGKDLSSKSPANTSRTPTNRNSNANSEKGSKVLLNKNSGANSVKAGSNNLGTNGNADRKSPGSPKTFMAGSNASSTSSSNSKAETEQDDGKANSDGEKMDQAPKVPPLKIVIPPQTANEPEQGNRNGKNSASRHHHHHHHQALPYVVTSNNEVEKEGLRSGSTSPTDSFKSDEKKDPAIGMLSAEDQKNSLHHQRVLRSSHRSGPGGANENRTQESGATNVSNNGSSNVNAPPTDNLSPQAQNRTSPLPQNESSATAPGVSVANDSSSSSSNSSNTRSNIAPPSKNNQGSSNATPAVTSEDKTSDGNTESSQVPSQPATSASVPVELHPRKRKLKHNKEIKESPPPQTTNERCESGTTSTDVHPHEQPVQNCYQLFLDIRKQIERRRKGLFPVQPKPPQGFKDYLMNRCTYILAGNASTRQIPSSPLPQNISTPMKDLFIEQEKERHRLRLQHVIEKEKLVLSVEQEILRVHGRAARALANQSLPFSACTILKDEEVYNLITPEQEEKDRNARSRYNGRLFLSWLQDVDDKWEKIKEAMLLRHHNEAESLHAVQKMDWEWKMKELGFCEYKSKPVILDNHVPMVHVSDDFDLLPA